MAAALLLTPNPGAKSIFHLNNKQNPHKIVPNNPLQALWSLECSVWADKREHRLWGNWKHSWLTPCILHYSPQWKSPWGIQCLKSFANCQQWEQRRYQAIPWKTVPCWAPWSKPHLIQMSVWLWNVLPSLTPRPGFPRAQKAPAVLTALQVHLSPAALKWRIH